ncbi:MAG TPA: RNA polymerase sigma-70 factor [Gemmatimonadaceae bacterium]
MQPPSFQDDPVDPAELQRWVERIGEGDEEALAALFRATYAPLCRHARAYVRSAAAAEDLVDDLFLALWLNRAQLGVRGSVLNYLHTAVRNRALNQVKRERTEARHMLARWVEQSSTPPRRPGANEVEDQFQTAELMALLSVAIDALPPRTRQAYTLYCQHGMRYADIARVMGTSVRTVEHQIAKAVRTLWNRLGEYTR